MATDPVDLGGTTSIAPLAPEALRRGALTNDIVWVDAPRVRNNVTDSYRRLNVGR